MSFLRLASAMTVMVACAYADIMTFTHTGTGSGTVGATSFSNAAFTITDKAETANRQAISGTGFYIDDFSASISISGVGTFDFITGTRTFVNQNSQIVGFSRAGLSGADLFNGPVNAAFATYDLQSSIGPISGTGSLLQWSSSPVNTSGGVLVFNNGVSDTRFTASVASSVPEPSSWALLGTALLGICAAMRLRSNRLAR